MLSTGAPDFLDVIRKAGVQASAGVAGQWGLPVHGKVLGGRFQLN